MNFKRLKLLRSAARVKRCHTMPVLYPQTVGEHTFGVLSVLLTIWEIPSVHLMKAITYHDVPEALTGDVPAPTKWVHPDLEEVLKAVEARIEKEFELDIPLTTKEYQILKYCDLMELALYASEEADSGNSCMVVVLRNALHAIRKRGIEDVTPAAKELFDFISARTEKRYDSLYGEDTLNGWPSYG